MDEFSLNAKERQSRSMNTRSMNSRSRSSSRTAKNNPLNNEQTEIIPLRSILALPNDRTPSIQSPNQFEKILYENNAPQTEYFVLVDYSPVKSTANERKRINELKLFSVLKQLNLIEGFKKVKRIGFRRCKVLFETAIQANKVVNAEKDLLVHKLKSFIPKNFVQKFGIIKEVPKAFTERELKEDIVSEITIKEVTRFTFPDLDNPQLRRPTNTIKVSFLGNVIPTRVFLHSIPLKVEYYIPKPKQCTKCGRLGHMAKLCKNTKIPCLRCGKVPRCENDCDKTDHKCLLCGSKDHTCVSASIKNCPKKNEQQEVNRLMSIGNLSFSEVREKYSFQNSFEVLQNIDYEVDFPETTSKPNSSVRNNLDEMNRSIRRHNTFSNVVKQPKKNVPSTQSNELIQAEPMVYGNQSVFNFAFEKTSEAEKLLNSLMRTYQQIADQSNNEELNNKLKTARNAFQNLILCNDDVLIKSGIENGESSTNQHSKLE